MFREALSLALAFIVLLFWIPLLGSTYDDRTLASKFLGKRKLKIGGLGFFKFGLMA